MRLLVRGDHPVIAAAVEGDVDRVSERSHRLLSLAAVAGTWRTVIRPAPPPFLIGPPAGPAGRARGSHARSTDGPAPCPASAGRGQHLARLSCPSGASTLREEMAVSGQRLLAASGQILMAAYTPCGYRSSGPAWTPLRPFFQDRTRCDHGEQAGDVRPVPCRSTPASGHGHGHGRGRGW
jgi:hypothetical protein